MVDVNTQSKTISVNVSSSGVSSNVNASGDTTLYYSNKAREWAISDRIVDGVDYSSKYYANKANESAVKVENSLIRVEETKNNAIDEITSIKDSAVNNVQDISANSIADIEQAKNNTIQNISDEGQKQIDNIESTGFYMRDDKLYFINSEGVETEFESGSGFNLFDTKISDHILEGEEALGWALQGTYVYKEGVAGSRTGYADFYNKCVEEYNNSTLDIEVKKVWNLPVLTSNTSSNEIIITDPKLSGGKGSVAGDIVFGTSAVTSFSDVYKSLDNDDSTYFQLNAVNFGWNIFDIEFVTPKAINSFYAKGSAISSVACSLVALKVYNINNDQEPVLLGENVKANVCEVEFGTVITNKIRVCLQSNNDGASYRTRLTTINIGAYTPLNVYKNKNSHRFYNISDKAIIDEIYNNTGIADYYGVDTENERIFLPRETARYLVESKKATDTNHGWYNLYSDGWLEQGGGVQSIVATPTVTFHKPFINTNYSLLITQTNNQTSALGVYQQTTSSFSWNTQSGDRSAYWQVEGYTSIPTNLPKYKYYCVGNTKLESALSNVTEITTSENDTLPLFHNFYSKEDMTTTGAYVNASLGSWLSGNVYTTAYNELVNKLGTDNVKANTDTYTDYDFVVNQDEMSFRLPLKNGQEIMFATAVKGNGMAVGLTNGTDKLGLYSSYSGSVNMVQARQSAYNAPIAKDVTDIPVISIGHSNLGIETDSSKSGIELDTENITIPDSWNLYYKVANALTNLELLDVAKVTADLNTCYKRNAGDNSDLSGLGMPSNRYITLATGASGSTYTMPANGYFTYILKATTASSSWGMVMNTTIGMGDSLDLCRNSATFRGNMPVRKGDVISVTFASCTVDAVLFRYAEGEV